MLKIPETVVKTAGQARRRALKIASKCLKANNNHERVAAAADLRHLYNDVLKNVPLKAIGLPEINAMGLAVHSTVWHPIPAKLIEHAVHTVSWNIQRINADNLYVWNLLNTTQDMDDKTRGRILNLCDEVLAIVNPEIPSMNARSLHNILRWAVNVHKDIENTAKASVPLSLPKVQFFNDAADRLTHPLVYSSLGIREVSRTLHGYAQVRLTPEGLCDSFAVHVMDELLPSLKEKHSLTDATEVIDVAGIKRMEIDNIAQAISAFSKAAELGRVPLRDVLEGLARYILDSDAPLLHFAGTKQLVRISYLSVAVSKKWGHSSEIVDEEPIRRVLAQVGELSLAEINANCLLAKDEWQWRFLLNMTQAGELETVTQWLDLLVNNPDTDPKLLSTITYAVARVKDGLGYRDILNTTPTDKESDAAAVDAETETVRTALSYFGVIRDRFLLPKAHMLDMKHSALIMYAYAKAQMLDEVMAVLMIGIFCNEIEKAELIPPYVVTNFLYALGLQQPEQLSQTDLQMPFQAVEAKLDKGELDFTPEKPNFTVYVLWAMQKVKYESKNMTKMLCELLPEEAVERLHFTTAAMAVDALAKHPCMSIVTGTVLLIINTTARQMEISGTTNLVLVDILMLGISRGRWNKDDMVEAMFRLSKAVMVSGSGKALERLNGKCLARLLWSHSVVMVKHTLLCGEIVKMFENKDFVKDKMDNPLSVTSALVAMSRLRLKNQLAVGNLCSVTATQTALMPAISLADTVQALAELRVPSRGLQVMLCAQVVNKNMEFTAEQASSFTWNLARSMVVPTVLKDAVERDVVAHSYKLLLTKVAKQASGMDVKHACRALQTLGLLHPTNSYPNLVPPLYRAVLANIEHTWWRDLANFLWALATLEHRPPDADLKVISHCRARQSFTPEDEARVKVWDAFVLSHNAESSK